MSGKDLFYAIGQIDEKTAAGNVSRFNKKPKDPKRAEMISNVFSGLKIAAGVAVILAIAVTVWLSSILFRDPPINPAESGTGTALYHTEPPTDTEPNSTDTPETDVDRQTEKDTHTEPVTDEQTEPVTVNSTETEESVLNPPTTETKAETLARAIVEYLSQDFKKRVESSKGATEITVTSFDDPREAEGDFYGGWHIYAASKIEIDGENAYAAKYFALAAEPDVAFTADEEVERVGDYLFRYNSGVRISTVIGDKYYYGLKKAYEAGVINDDDLYAASFCFGDDCAGLGYSAIRLNGKTTGLKAIHVKDMLMFPFVGLMDKMFGVKEAGEFKYTFTFKGKEYFIRTDIKAAGLVSDSKNMLLIPPGCDFSGSIITPVYTASDGELYVESNVLFASFFGFGEIDAAAQIPDAHGDINVKIDLTEPTEVKVKSISVSCPSRLLEVGKSMKLTAVISPDNASDKTVTWGIESGFQYANLNPDGTVTGVKAGECNIRVRAKDGSNVSALITIYVTEPTAEDQKREFRSKQSSHTTPSNITAPTKMDESPQHEGGGVDKEAPARVYFKVIDCGFEQFEELLGNHGRYDMCSPDTSRYWTMFRNGEFKVWLCTLDGEKIDYVYANANRIVGFDLYPGEYQVMFEDDGTYKTLYSSIIKVEENEDNRRYSYPLYVQIINPLGYDTDRAWLHVYNYQWYDPVTITVTDDETGEPLADTYIAYHAAFLSSQYMDRYYKTDSDGKLSLSCIFDIIDKVNVAFMGSWHDDITLYFKKDGYDPIVVKTDNVRETGFNIRLHKTERYDYTILVLNSTTGEPVEGATLEINTSTSGDAIIGTSGADGILKGYFYSKDLKDIYGVMYSPDEIQSRAFVGVQYISEADVSYMGYPAKGNIPVWQPDNEGPFIALYTPSNAETYTLASIFPAPEGTELPLVITLRGIAFSEDPIFVNVGESVKLTPIYYPENAERKDVTWRISRGEAYGSISEDGTFTAKAPGECIIVVTAVGCDPWVSGAVTIRIVEPETEQATADDNSVIILQKTIFDRKTAKSRNDATLDFAGEDNGKKKKTNVN